MRCRKIVRPIAVLAVGLLCTWPGQASARSGQSVERESQPRQMSAEIPSRYGDHDEITASSGYLVGGEGAKGDVMQYRGERIWTGPGSATVLVREPENTGFLMGTVRTHGHTYTVLMNRFSGDQSFMSGGIAKNVKLHGMTGQGEPILPKVDARVAGWGQPCTIWKDAVILHDGLKCHFMLTDQIRDPKTHRIRDFPSAPEIRELTKARREQSFYDEPLWFGTFYQEPIEFEARSGEEMRDVERKIREAGDTSRSGLQLHVIAHSPETDFSKLPPYETVMHFMWDEVEWRPGRDAARTAAAPPSRTYSKEFDERLKKDITRYIKRNPYLDHKEMDVQVDDGVVTLLGVVDTTAEAEDVREYAQKAGAREVRDELVATAVVEGDWEGLSAPFGSSSDSGTFDYFNF